MHKKTAPLFVHYGEPEKIKKSFAFNVDIFSLSLQRKKHFLFPTICDILITGPIVRQLRIVQFLTVGSSGFCLVYE